MTDEKGLQRQEKPPPLNWKAPVSNEQTLMRVVKNRGVQERVKEIAARGVDINRMAAQAILAARKVPALLRCTSESVFLACLEAAKCGLEIDGVQGALVPFKGQAQFVPMYQGMVGALIVDKVVSSVWAEVVYENDLFVVSMGTSRGIEHIPAPFRTDGQRSDDRGAMRAAYAVARLPDASTTFRVMTREDIEKRRRVSKTADREDSPWNVWPEEMWRKSVLKGLNKWLGARTQRIRNIMAADDRAEMGEQPADEVRVELRVQDESRAKTRAILDRWDAADEEDPTRAALPPGDRLPGDERSILDDEDEPLDDEDFAERRRREAEAAADAAFAAARDAPITDEDTNTGAGLHEPPELPGMPPRQTPEPEDR